MMNEIGRMYAGDVTEKDLRSAKSARINAFPSMFSTTFGNITNFAECKAGADKSLPNQGAIDAMAAKYGGRTIDGLAKKLGDGTVHVVTLK
jgi:hypothetical protein